MGSAVGGAYRAGGARVVTTVAGRSSRSADFARAAQLELLDDLDAVVRVSDVVVSLVPPGQAGATAGTIAEAAERTGSRPLLLDANAVSPETVQGLPGPLDVVDGSVSGPPPGPDDRRRSRLYLSGPRAAEVAAVPAPWLDVRAVGTEVGTASAVKMCTAGYSKGRMALAAHALLTADAHGVTDLVVDDLGDLLPAPAGVARAASKAWRFVDEMTEIAATQGRAGLPAELFEGFAAAYAALAQRAAGRHPEAVPADVDWAAVLQGLRRPGDGPAR